MRKPHDNSLDEPRLTLPHRRSSIISGLVYYDQVSSLSWLQIALVTLGTAVLLLGVWIVSIKKDREQEENVQLSTAVEQQPYSDEPEAMGSDDGGDSEGERVQWVPRGLTIGSKQTFGVSAVPSLNSC